MAHEGEGEGGERDGCLRIYVGQFEVATLARRLPRVTHALPVTLKSYGLYRIQYGEEYHDEDGCPTTVPKHTDVFKRCEGQINH